MNSSADRPERAVILRREMLTNACERETAEANIDEKDTCVYPHTGTQPEFRLTETPLR